jgi:predicted nucleotidyltransferase
MDSKLELIKTRIVQAVNPDKIILFGSRAENRADAQSDYDLVIIYDGDRTKREIKRAVYNLFIPPGFSLDLFVFTSTEFEIQKNVPNSLAKEVYNKGVVIYG